MYECGSNISKVKLDESRDEIIIRISGATSIRIGPPFSIKQFALRPQLE